VWANCDIDVGRCCLGISLSNKVSNIIRRLIDNIKLLLICILLLSHSFILLYVLFWVIPRRLNFICRRFGTICLFHLHRQVGTYLPMKMEQSVPKRRHIKFRRRGITQKKTYNIEHGESLKSRILSYSLGSIFSMYIWLYSCLIL
jgi:hypothetical protein